MIKVVCLFLTHEVYSILKYFLMGNFFKEERSMDESF